MAECLCLGLINIAPRHLPPRGAMELLWRCGIRIFSTEIMQSACAQRCTLAIGLGTWARDRGPDQNGTFEVPVCQQLVRADAAASPGVPAAPETRLEAAPETLVGLEKAR